MQQATNLTLTVKRHCLELQVMAKLFPVGFDSNFQRERIQEMCKTLRVLNAVRNPEIGIPLSIQQYKTLTAPVLIARLINAHQHLLALRISEYLGTNQEVVIMHWACSKITASLAIPDAALLEILLDKLRLCKGISYAAVAAHADKSGRRKLAAMLVEHEPRSSKQVPLLLSIGEEDTALVKAIESGDTDLVYLVLFHIWQKRPALEFFGTIQARPLARDMFITYARCYKHEFLKDFFLSTGQLQEVAYLLWKESWEIGKNPMASRGSALHGPRIKMIDKAQNLFAETKEHTFESKAAEEHAKLIRIQHELEVATKQAIFVDSSISDTIRTCIVLGNDKFATKVKTEFKVSEKRWYWLKVFALATVGNWDALEKFSREKRPPIGYRPFVEACMDADEKGEALKYIPKLADPRERAEAYARIGMAKEAADAASQAKDGELLGRLRMSFAQNNAASSLFDTLRDRLSFQGVP
ncbi:Protein VACUOLELESS1 [Linum perenne]